MLWMSMVPATLRANPQGEVVVGGAAGFSRPDAATLIVKQQTDRAVINWNSFSIANGELTKFVQPSSSSSVLNRVVTANPSQIYGTLQGNGQVFLINPGGVLVGAGGQVNTASFMASTRDVSTEDFMRAGTMNFTGNSDASVVNKGQIEASTGDVFLVAQEVKNEGQIMAKDGTVGLVSGTSVTLETVGPGRHYKVRLMDVEKPSDSSRTSEAAAEIVNEGVIDAANVELEATGNYLSLAIKNTGTIRATGLVQNADGSVTLTGGEGDVLNTGVVAALQKSVNGVEQGGVIDISGRNIRAEEGSLITASGQESGGKIKIQSKDTTMLAGRVEATGYSAKSMGGRVEALGSQVGLRAGEINVDGGAKGGTVLVGGDYLGSNRDIPNAKAVAMLPDAKISADARENGDGGKVILWSDEYTGFFGRITALGGAEGGNGGFIETSSKNNLQAFGEAQASAPKGLAGEWLLDPSNVIVGTTATSGGSFSGGNPTIFTPANVDTAFILNTQVNSALNLGTSVTITTGSATTLDCGIITIDAPISKTYGGNATLTLDSDSGIVINADITSVSNSLFMNFQADSNADGFGSFTLATAANLFSNGGNITVTAADVDIQGTMNTLKVIQAPVTVNNGGSYAVATVPTVSIGTGTVAQGGVAASAIAVMGLDDAAVISSGSGYTSVPTVRIIGGGGQNAVLTPVMGVPTGSSATTIETPGTGYIVGDLVNIAGGGGSGATGTVTAVNGAGGITGINVVTSGSNYTFLPSANVTSAVGTGACIEINQLFVADVGVTNPGTGYTGALQLEINGGGGSGATAQINTVRVVNLAFDGTSPNPDVAAPSYGVGYAAGQTLSTTPTQIVFTGTGAGGADLNIGPMVNVAGDIVLKPSLNAATVGVGTGAGLFNVSNTELGRLSVTGSILPGTVTVGSRAAGALQAGGITFGNQNLTLSTGAGITGVVAEGAGNNLTLTGLLTLDAAGSIGNNTGAGNGLQVSAPRLVVVTEGNFFNLYDSATLTQFHVTTDGTVADQRIVDNQIGISNLNWFVTEAGGATSINGITVLNNSVDIRYENSIGGLTVFGGGVSSVLIDAVNVAANGITFAPPDIAGGVQATATIAAGVVTITNPGSGYSIAPIVTLTGGATLQNFAGLGTLNVQPANNGLPADFRDFLLAAPLGNITTAVPIFSGGGNLTLQAADIFLPAFGRASLTLTDVPGVELATVAYANLGVLNTFESANALQQSGTITYQGSSFGQRLVLQPNQVGAGSISGTGGVLSIEATSPSAEGRKIDLSAAGGFANTMNISVRETQLLEAPGIRIGGQQTADILLQSMDTPLIFQQGTTTRVTGSPPSNATYTYDPRYFENPFFNATRLNTEPLNVDSTSGNPHVLGGTVALVSALGAARNVQGGDVNVGALTMTGLDEVFFDARSENGLYAALTLATANGSIIGAISGRVGRTLQDGTTLGNGGDLTFNLNPTTGWVNDGRLPIFGVLSNYTVNQEATAGASLVGGQLSSITLNNPGMLYRYEPVVSITGGGVQEASLRAVLDGTGVGLIAPQVRGVGYTPSVLNPTTGLTTGPDVSIIGNGSGALVGNGGKAFISDNGYISPFSVVNGGAGYSAAAPPQVIVSGGGSGVTRPAVLRTEVNSAGQVTELIVVDPGAGYDNSSISILIQAPSRGGIRAQGILDNDFRPTAFGNSLNPVYVSSAGTGYTVEPSVAITGGGVRQAQAKAVLQVAPDSNTFGQLAGFIITDAGLGYSSAPTITIGSGQAFGNFGEYGVSTETVDRNVGSGNISISNGPNPLVGGLTLNAPVRTGDALGVSGGDAITGSILLDIYVDLSANDNNTLAAFAPNPGGARGIVMTGDASVIPGASGVGNARSGSVTIVARSISNDATSTLAILSGSTGLPIQIGTATGGVSNISGNLNASLQLRDATNIEVGDLQIYAPAPGQVQLVLGNVPLDPNHPLGSPRTSNDLALSGLTTPETSTDDGGSTRPDESLVSVEVGAVEGKLTLLRRSESQATATVVNGRVTLVTPDQGGELYIVAPTVTFTGGGIVPAVASAFVFQGTLTAPDGSNTISVGNGLDVAGEGYYTLPQVLFTGGGGSGAQGVAVIDTSGHITAIRITDAGYGYTTLPSVVISSPSGTQASASATVENGTIQNTTLTVANGGITNAGIGYTTAPQVTVTGGQYGTATATATVSSTTSLSTITITLNGDIFPAGTATVTVAQPAGVALATATLENGLISSFTIESPGGGYTSSPTVLLSTGTSNNPYALTLDRVGFIADRIQVFDATTPSNILIEAGLAAIAPWTNQRPVNMGTIVAGASSYTQSDLQRFLVNDLVVGRRNPNYIGVGAGEITISSAFLQEQLRVANGIFLAGTRGLADLGGSTGISFDAASINLGSTVNLTGSGNKIHYLAGIIQGPFDELTYAKSFTLSSGLRVLGTSSQALTVGEVYGNPAYFTGQRFNQGLTTQNGDVNLFADLIEQTRLVGFIDTTAGGKYPVGNVESAITADRATVTLAPLTSARPISIYYNSPGSGLALRISNPNARGLEQVRAGTIKIGSSTSGTITLNSDFGFNYLQYPDAPRTLILTTAGGITLGLSQIPPSPTPEPSISRILVPGLSLDSAGTVSLGTGANQVSFFAARMTQAGQNLNFASAANELTVADFTTQGGVRGIVTSGGDVTLSAARINLPTLPTTGGASIQAVGQRVTLQPYSAATAINLGTKGSTGFALTNEEMNNISGSILQIGNATAGGITVSTPISLLQTDPIATTPVITTALSLLSSSGITDVGGVSGISYSGGLRLSSVGTISFTGTGNDFGTVAANSSGNPITLSSGAFSIGTVDSLTGITGAGSRVILQPNVAGTAIDLGTNSGWSFTDSELDLVTASILQIGRSNAGQITVSAAMTLPSTLPILDLETAAGVADAGGSSGLAVTSLAIRGGTGAVSLDGAGNNVSNLAGVVTGPFSFTDNFASAAAPLNITTVDGLSGIDTSAGNGAIILTADDMNIVQAVQAGSGVITLQPLTLSTNISLNDPTTSLALSTAELQILSSSSTVVIGNGSGTGTISIGGSGSIDLSGESYSFTLRGSSSPAVFNGGVTLATGKLFNVAVGTGAVTSPFAGTDVTIGGAGVIQFGSAGSVGTVANPLTSLVASLGASSVVGQINLVNNQTLGIIGNISSTAGAIYLSSSAGGLSNTGGSISAPGTVTLEGDTLTLSNLVTGNGGIYLQPFTASRAINVFTSGAGGFEVTSASFGQLAGTSAVVIGRSVSNPVGISNSSGNVTVGGLNPLGRDLTVQSPDLAFGGTFDVTGAINGSTYGADLVLNGGSGVLTSNFTINLGEGSASLIGQSINLNALLTANGGVSFANGVAGDVYLATAGAGANDLNIGAGTLANISTTRSVGFGRLANPDGTPSASNVYVGAVSIGSVAFPFGGLTLLAGSAGVVELRGDITSQSKPIYIDGPVVLVGSWQIAMNNTVTTGANLTLLNGIRGTPTSADLTITMGTGANTLTLAGGESTDRMGTLSITLGGAGLVLGAADGVTPEPYNASQIYPNGVSPTRGLNLGLTESFTMPAGATMVGGAISLLVDGGGNSLTTTAGPLVGNQALSLTTTGLNGVIATGAITASSVTLTTDVLNLGSTVLATTGDVQWSKSTRTQTITLGAGGDLNQAQALLLQAPQGGVIFGDNTPATGTTAGIIVNGPMNLSSSGTLSYALETLGTLGGVTFAGTAPVFTLPSSGSLRIAAGAGQITGPSGVALTGSGATLSIDSASLVDLRTDVGTYGPVLTADGPVTLVNAGSIILGGTFDTGIGNISIRTLSGNLTLATSVAGGTIQLGGAQNFINQAGSNPFTNRNGGRSLVYSAGQRFDTPYNFAGLNGFGVAFGQAYGSMPSSGNYLVYSSYADVGLDNGWQYGSFFAGNSVSALMPYGLFEDVNSLYLPNARLFNLEYMLYPDRVEPETLTLPSSVLGNLEETLGRPPTMMEIQQREVAIREAAMAKKGAIMERSSFDPAIEEKDEEERAAGEKVENSDGGVPQAQVEQREPISDGAKPMARLPVSAPQAGKSAPIKQGSTGPILRSGPMRAVVLLRSATPEDEMKAKDAPTQAVHLDVKSVIEQERASAEVGIAPPIAAGR
jgi:filamentous hemagglutinin family protein